MTGDGIAIVRIDNPPVNALDPAVFAALVRRLEEVQAEGARAVILSGAGDAFSAGADLFRVLDAADAELEEAVPEAGRAFDAFLRFPLPIVAAINGHAIAGGCVLACACDWRIARSGDVRIGLAELSVGVPFPAAALEIVRNAVAPRHLRELVLLARLYTPEEAAARALIDEVVAPEALMDRAHEVARRLARVPQATFAHTKYQLRRPAIEAVERWAGPEDAAAGRIWGSEEVRASIRAFLDRTIGGTR